MAEATGKQLKRLPERAAVDEREAALIRLQREADEQGLELFRNRIFDPSSDGEIAERLSAAAEEAGRLLSGALLDYREGGFFARYFYEAPKQAETPPQIVYPSDYFYHSAYIVGGIDAVQPVVVEHPHMRRKGPLGYRLCAVTDATRIMGWSSKTPNRVYLPVGEILFQELSLEQSTAESITPDVNHPED